MFGLLQFFLFSVRRNLNCKFHRVKTLKSYELDVIGSSFKTTKEWKQFRLNASYVDGLPSDQWFGRLLLPIETLPAKWEIFSCHRKSYKRKSKKSSSNREILKLTSIWVLLKSFDHFPVAKWSLLWIWKEQRQKTQWPLREVISLNGSFVISVTIRMPKITSNYVLYFLLLKWRSYFRKNQGLSAEHWGTFWHTAAGQSHPYQFCCGQL